MQPPKLRLPVARCGLLLVLAALLSPAPSLAVDGAVDVRNTVQSGRAGPDTFDTSFLRQILFVRDRFPLGQKLSLRADFQWQRELSGNTFNQVRQDANRITRLGNLDLSYRSKRANLGGRGQWYSRDASVVAVPSAKLNRQLYEAYLQFRPFSETRLWTTLSHRESQRRGGLEARLDAQERVGFLDVQQGLYQFGHLQYRLNGNSRETQDPRLQQSQTSHLIKYNGSTRFAGRADASLQVRSIFSSQSAERGEEGETRLLLSPVAGGVLLDDTPGERDPLEGAPTPVPELYDRDLDTPTEIDIGDAAVPVREFGGDYRNIQFDFGASGDLASAFLYVDVPLLVPQLIQWRVFVTDDPEAEIWVELDPQQALVEYRELDTGRQGWEVVLSPGIAARHFKMVNFKLGITQPSIRVTEMEVFTRTTTEVDRAEFRFEDHRIDGSLGTRITSDWDARYNVRVLERRGFGFGRDLSQQSHSLITRWTTGPYLLTGQVRVEGLDEGDDRATDLNQYLASIARGLGTPFSLRLSYNHTNNRAPDVANLSDILSFLADWRAAPGLRISQRVSYGSQRLRPQNLNASSIGFVTLIESRPLTNLTVNLERSDRWVSQALSSGLRNFNDSGLLVVWTPVPFINLSSNVRYLVRQISEWTVRNFATWTPFRGNKLEFLLSGNSFYESGPDRSQQGVTFTATYKPVRRLVLDASVSVQRLETAGVERTPTSTDVHLRWSF